MANFTPNYKWCSVRPLNRTDSSGSNRVPNDGRNRDDPDRNHVDPTPAIAVDRRSQTANGTDQSDPCAYRRDHRRRRYGIPSCDRGDGTAVRRHHGRANPDRFGHHRRNADMGGEAFRHRRHARTPSADLGRPGLGPSPSFV